MNDYVILNGNLTLDIPSDFFLKNRAFRLGDGFFETVRVSRGKVFGWDAHYARIQACCTAMGIEIHPIFSDKYMLDSLYNLLNKKGIRDGARARFTFYRDGEGAYLSSSNRLGYIAEIEPYFHNEYLLNDRGLIVDVCYDTKKHASPLSAYKMMGNFTSLQVAKWADEQKLSDGLIVNLNDEIIEATGSNIFVVRNGSLYTPSIASGCVAGTFRMAIVNAALNLRIPIFESKFNEQILMDADEIFLTNAIAGIKWVGSFKSKRYYHKMSDILIQEINRKQLVLS